MKRARTLIIAALTVGSALAGFVVAGEAFGADWMNYEGRLGAGNAYLLPVPSGAKLLEIALADGGRGQIGIFSPDDSHVGHYVLDADFPSARVVDPSAGGYVVFVYEASNATILARLKANEAPEKLEILKLRTHREDRSLASFDAPKALKQQLTIQLPRTPVFATLVYQGTVKNLDASIETEAGTLLSIRDESGSAYAPGLRFGDASGATELNFNSLAKGKYEIRATADEFEGELYLAILNFVRDAPAKPPAIAKHAPKAPKAPAPVEAPADPSLGAVAAISLHTPTAVRVDAGAEIVFAIPEAEMEEDEDDGDDRDAQGAEGGKRKRHHDGCGAVILLYSPTDDLVEILEINSEEPIASIVAGESGEFVVFALGSAEEIHVGIAGSDVAPEIRPLEMVPVGEATLHGGMDLGYSTTAVIEMPTPLLYFHLEYGGMEAVAVDYRATLTSEAGIVYEESRPFQVSEFYWANYASYSIENLVKGEYELTVSGLTPTGETRFTAFSYDRELTLEIDEDSEENHDHGHEGGALPTPLAPVRSAVEATASLARGLLGR